MTGDQEPWVFRGGLTRDLQVRTAEERELKQLKNNTFPIKKSRYDSIYSYLLQSGLQVQRYPSDLRGGDLSAAAGQ